MSTRKMESLFLLIKSLKFTRPPLINHQPSRRQTPYLSEIHAT